MAFCVAFKSGRGGELNLESRARVMARFSLHPIIISRVLGNLGPESRLRQGGSLIINEI